MPTSPGLDVSGGPPAPALVVVHETEGVGESVHLREQVGVVEVGTAVQHDDRRTLADGSAVEPSAVDRHVPFERAAVTGEEARGRHGAHGVSSRRPSELARTTWVL